MELVTSRQNPTFKLIRGIISDKKTRLESRLFWIDGVNFVDKAVQNGWKINKLIFVPEEINTDFRKEVLEKVSEDLRIPFAKDLYQDIANKKDIQGIGALAEIKFEKNKLFDGAGVVVENISNPGNLGMIMRTCAAFNVKNLYIINPAVDPFNPESIRSSMESVFYLNISVFDSLNQIKEQLIGSKYTSFGTSLQDDSVELKSFPEKFNVNDNVLLWFGNEAKGMSNDAKALCQKLLNIKMNENVDSLNIAGSASIFLYELFN